MENRVPAFLREHQIFRVRPGSFYDVHYRGRLDEYGNIRAFVLMTESTFAAWGQAIDRRDLVDVTDDPTRSLTLKPRGSSTPTQPQKPVVPQWKNELAKLAESKKAKVKQALIGKPKLEEKNEKPHE